MFKIILYLCVIKLKMKQDTKGRDLFRQVVDETPEDLKKQLRYSDAIAIKLYGMLKQRGMSQRDLAKKRAKQKPRCHGGWAERIIIPFGLWPRYLLFLGRMLS